MCWDAGLSHILEATARCAAAAAAGKLRGVWGTPRSAAAPPGASALTALCRAHNTQRAP